MEPPSTGGIVFQHKNSKFGSEKATTELDAHFDVHVQSEISEEGPEHDDRTSSGAVEQVQQLVDPKQYLTGIKLALVFLGLILSAFLIQLDQTIVATAQPKIVSHFDALDKIAWVSSAYFLTEGGFILTVGQILTICSTKTIYLVSISLFELGSLFCGVAPSINFLILGRAVAGVGAAGIIISIFSIIAEVTRLEDRAVLFGALAACFAVSSTVGPLLGGAFTDRVSWRWCFYINLPFGAFAAASIALFLRVKGVTKKDSPSRGSIIKRLLSLDYLGTILCLGCLSSLLLALQWGGNSKPWGDKDVIATLVTSVLLFILLVSWEWHRGNEAMIPFRLLKRITQVGPAFEAFFIFLGMLMGTYYLPLWYQAKGASASRSGVDVLAFMLSCVLGALLSGAIINKTGRYWHWLVFSPLLSSIGSGLLFTIHSDTPNSSVIGFQILLGFGLGGAIQNTIIAVQTEYAHEEHLIPQGTSFVNFVQIVGGIVGISVGAAIFGNQLASNLPKFAPSLDVAEVAAVRSSVTAIFNLPKEIQPNVIDAYAYSLNRVFLLGVPAGILASFCGIITKNYDIRERSPTVANKAEECQQKEIVSQV